MKLAPMTVIQKSELGPKPAVIDLIHDVLYVTRENGKLLYHTESAIYYAITSLEELDSLVDNYWMLDTNNTVNMSKIQKVGHYLKAYFTRTPTKSSKYASISWICFRTLRKQIEHMIENNLSRSTPWK